MIIFDEFAFCSAPRTGTTFFLKAMHAAGFGEHTKTGIHTVPLNNWEPGQQPIVSLVRHPYDWLVSYHQELQGGKIGVDVVDFFAEIVTSSENVYNFIHRVANESPGAVGRLFDAYRSDIVLRIEDFPFCVAEFFETIGRGHAYEKITKIPPQNARKGRPHLVNKDLRRLVTKSENDLCERYEYF